MKNEQLNELLYESLETETGIQVYRTALRGVVNDELKTEWEKYLEGKDNWRAPFRYPHKGPQFLWSDSLFRLTPP
jgi:hypothetical protein